MKLFQGKLQHFYIYTIISHIILIMIIQVNCDWLMKCGKCKCKWNSGKKTADCKNQSLTYIPNYLSSELQVLDLSNNHIIRIEENAFTIADLQNLHKLFMRNCSMERLHPVGLKGLEILIELDLSNNLLKTLPRDAFISLVKVRSLILNQNFIEILENGLFRNLKYLHKIELKENRICRVNTDVFINVPYLSQIFLNDNQLNFLRKDTFEKLKRLASLSLDSNPWNCTCELQIFRDFALKRNLYTPPTSCYYPSNLRGILWNDENSGAFACKPKILYPSRGASINTSKENVTLICRVHASPNTIIAWDYNKQIYSSINYQARVHIQLLREENGSGGNGFNGVGSSSSSALTNQNGNNNADKEIGRDIFISRLTIIGAEKSDEGIYTCLAENPGGKDEVQMSLLVQKHNQTDLLLQNNLIIVICLMVLGLLSASIFLAMITCCIYKRFKSINHHQHQHHHHHHGGIVVGGGGGGGGGNSSSAGVGIDINSDGQNNITATTTTTDDTTNDTQKRTNTYHHVVNTIDNNDINRNSPTNSITIPINSTTTTSMITATTTTTINAAAATTTLSTTANPASNQYFNNLKTIDNNKENNYIEIPSPTPQQQLRSKMLNGNGHLIGTTINNFTDLNDSSRRIYHENQNQESLHKSYHQIGKYDRMPNNYGTGAGSSIITGIGGGGGGNFQTGPTKIPPNPMKRQPGPIQHETSSSSAAITEHSNHLMKTEYQPDLLPFVPQSISLTNPNLYNASYDINLYDKQNHHHNNIGKTTSARNNTIIPDSSGISGSLMQQQQQHQIDNFRYPNQFLTNQTTSEYLQTGYIELTDRKSIQTTSQQINQPQQYQTLNRNHHILTNGGKLIRKHQQQSLNTNNIISSSLRQLYEQNRVGDDEPNQIGFEMDGDEHEEDHHDNERYNNSLENHQQHEQQQNRQRRQSIVTTSPSLNFLTTNYYPRRQLL